MVVLRSVPLLLAALTLFAIPASAQEVPADDAGPSACSVYDWNLPGEKPGLDPLHEDVDEMALKVGTWAVGAVVNMFIVDPDGCIRSFIRRTLGWPPGEELPTLSAL